MKKILIIGANSAIAEAVARIYARQGEALYLVGRNKERLSSLTKDLSIRGCPKVSWDILDVNDFNAHARVLSTALEKMGEFDVVLMAHGTLPNQAQCEQDIEETLKQLNTNALSTISLLTHIANRLETQQRGTVAVISSVAGDRGRQSNYVYGTAKAAVTTYMQGLRNRLNNSGVNVLTIKPGFVDTPMTIDFNKGILWSSPEKIALGIISSIEAKKDVVYLPWFWRWIMMIIKLIPEPIFKKLRL